MPAVTVDNPITLPHLARPSPDTSVPRPVELVVSAHESTEGAGGVAAGVPAEYGEMLRMLTETIASRMGSRPNDNVQKVTGAPPISGR